MTTITQAQPVSTTLPFMPGITHVEKALNGAGAPGSFTTDAAEEASKPGLNSHSAVGREVSEWAASATSYDIDQLIGVLAEAFGLSLEMQSVARERIARFCRMVQQQQISRKDTTISSANKELSAAALSLGAVFTLAAIGGCLQYKSTVVNQQSTGIKSTLKSPPADSAMPTQSPTSQQAAFEPPKIAGRADEGLQPPLSPSSTSLRTSGGMESADVKTLPPSHTDVLPAGQAELSPPSTSASVVQSQVDAVDDTIPAKIPSGADNLDSISSAPLSQQTPAEIKALNEHANALERKASKYHAWGGVFSSSAMAGGAVFTAGLHVAATQDRANSELLASSAQNLDGTKDSLERGAHATTDGASRYLTMLQDVLHSNEATAGSAARRL